MALENPNDKKSEDPLFSISETPTITSEKLNGKNYLAWSASVEFWFLRQGHYDHLEKSFDEISEEKRDQWKKLDYQLCPLLWQSVEPDILANFRTFKTCHSFWKKAQIVFAYNTQRLYDSAQKLVTLEQYDNDMISYVSKVQSVVEELKIYLETDNLEDIKKKLDKLYVMLVLQGMHPFYEHVRDQILTSPVVPSMENLIIHLLQVPSPQTDGNSTKASNRGGRGGLGNRRGHGGGGGCPQCSCHKRMCHTEDTCYCHHWFPEKKLQGLKDLKVVFRCATMDEVVIHTIRLPEQSTVGDVLDDLKTKVELSDHETELRLLKVFYHKIYKVISLNEKIEDINDHYMHQCTLRAEEIPMEEKYLGPQDRLIHVYHFNKYRVQQHMQIYNIGEPFFFVIHERETLAEIKVRIQKKLQVPDDEFFKWKFAFVSLGCPEYLQDSDIVSRLFQIGDVYGAWEQYLGLEHTYTSPKISYVVNQNRHSSEKPVKLENWY